MLFRYKKTGFGSWKHWIFKTTLFALFGTFKPKNFLMLLIVVGPLSLSDLFGSPWKYIIGVWALQPLLFTKTHNLPSEAWWYYSDSIRGFTRRLQEKSNVWILNTYCIVHFFVCLVLCFNALYNFFEPQLKQNGKQELQERGIATITTGGMALLFGPIFDH